jgi:uncharacterized protein (TIGR00730 family)
MINTLCVFCGAHTGNVDTYRHDAERLADALTQAGINLVYGGAKVGLMGIIANRMLSNGSNVIGVIPQSLVDVEIAHEKLTELHIVNSMHERKALLSKLSDGFIMLPGGPGSLEEFFEVITAAKLGYHTKPCGILNSDGYYNQLLNFLDHTVQQGFLRPAHRNLIVVDQDPKALINRFMNYQPSLNPEGINTSIAEESLIK